MSLLCRTSFSWKILLRIVPVLLVAPAFSVPLQTRSYEEEMMN
jgi:hypothetical protein